MTDPHPTTRIEHAIGDEANHWTPTLSVPAHAYAQALTKGLTSPLTEADTQVLADLFPELTAEWDLMSPDGWDAGIGIINALAHGHITDLSAPQAQPDYPGYAWLVEGDDLAELHGPTIVHDLRTAFDGDVLAAAHAFVNASPATDPDHRTDPTTVRPGPPSPRPRPGLRAEPGVGPPRRCSHHANHTDRPAQGDPAVTRTFPPDTQIAILSHTNIPAPYAALVDPADLADPARLETATVWLAHTTARALAIRLGADPALWPENTVILPDGTTLDRDPAIGLYPADGLNWHRWDEQSVNPDDPRAAYSHAVRDQSAGKRSTVTAHPGEHVREEFRAGRTAALALLRARACARLGDGR